MFFAFIFAVLLPIFVTWQDEIVNSRRVTEPTLLYFHFYLCGRWNLITNWYESWPLGSRNVTILTIQGHVTSSVTWPFESQRAISYWWSIGPKSLSLTDSEILCPKHHVPIGTMLNRHCACAISRDMCPYVICKYIFQFLTPLCLFTMPLLLSSDEE